MNDDTITELLSAYLDGESGDPEAVERLIGGDPAVRRRFEVLQSQSRALRALPPPEVAPEFAARVVAGVRQERFRPRRGWVALAAPWAVAAAVVLVLAAVYLAIQTPPEPGALPMAREITEWRDVDPDVLDSLLLERIAADPDALDALDNAYAGVAPDAGLRYAADDPARTVYEDDQLDALIEELTPDEEAVFRELLFAYAMEG